MMVPRNRRVTSYNRSMEEAKFRVGDVVRLRRERFKWHSLDLLNNAGVLWTASPNTVPAGCEGVVKQQVTYMTFDGSVIYGIAIPEARCYCFDDSQWLEFVEHQPSPEEIAAMYAELRA